ncbi:MAG TPA: LacI family DNA-binding transcriptional regulator [Candidatus Copromorpha excrementigallinarum]|uniref:LacI family DNA-binding transcriptional regulator n=1 Tax=Candidatus Allocopromorpha excrementigallinarum TaxID=2840742 RepID=A0A9D1HZF2_9FIRM|nr:LacI family DNA-binding transcriptional regulator [Candidatus Copromorpha excrementigallinarum]
MNIKQIAKAAGVSVATVSRVLNHPENVAPKTREKIENIIKELDYKPNWFAQGLNFNRTKTIGLVIPHILNPAYMEIAKGVEDVAQQKGYITFMCNVEKDIKQEKSYVEQLMTRRVDGIILMFSSLDEQYIKSVEKAGFPVVLIGENKDISEFNSVKVDCLIGAESIVNQLIENGHKTIGILYGSEPEIEALEMLEGYKRALRGKGMPLKEEYIKSVDNTIEGGYLGARKMINEGPPKAIFTTSDEIAYGAMDAIKDSELRVPEDIAVAGFGNTRMSNLVEPKLTTVELPFHKMGIYGARLLFDLIEGDGDEKGRNKEPTHITLQTKLKIRRSCGHKERIGEMF